jgi:acetylornithine deacetylase/succinyl-diaminopimelate desuccinylase-like protein
MYGPSSIDRAHTVGEWVAVDELVACAQALALTAWRHCC